MKIRNMAELFLAGVLSWAAVPGAAQPLAEIEPNHPCASAQLLGAVGKPKVVNAHLDRSPGPDLDFYRVTAAPGALLFIDQEGTWNNQGTLNDAYLAVYSADCSSVLATDDDGGEGWNARLLFEVPADGALVIVATNHEDWSLTGQGGSGGTYRLTVRDAGMAREVSGRVVSGADASPLYDAYITLYRCDKGSSCYYLTYAYTDSDGRFLFTNSPWYSPLYSGSYRLSIERYPYQPTEISFTLSAGQALDLENLPLTPIPTVGSIRARVVDSLTGEPMRGDQPPFARVSLERCKDESEWSCWTERYSVSTDAQGWVRFDETNGYPLLAGTYRLYVSAEQYNGKSSRRFEIGADADYVIGEVGLKSFPVRILRLDSCASIPAIGGTCDFRVQVTNGLSSPLTARIWSMVGASYTGSPAGSSSFEVPGAATTTLAPAASTEISGSLEVPGSLAPWSYFCVNAYVAPPESLFETLGVQSLFCIYKDYGGFRIASEEERRRLTLQALPPDPRDGNRQPPARRP